MPDFIFDNFNPRPCFTIRKGLSADVSLALVRRSCGNQGTQRGCPENEVGNTAGAWAVSHCMILSVSRNGLPVAVHSQCSRKCACEQGKTSAAGIAYRLALAVLAFSKSGGRTGAALRCLRRLEQDAAITWLIQHAIWLKHCAMRVTIDNQAPDTCDRLVTSGASLIRFINGLTAFKQWMATRTINFPATWMGACNEQAERIAPFLRMI